ncbi:MAG: hypothetical protein Q9191_003792 [Dirinaria sp. TL-2023a]
MLSTEYGYFLDESVDLGALDTSFFSLPRSEVERADPQQRLMLEVAQEAFQDAGITKWRGKTIGCYIGNFGEDWLEMFGKETQPWGIHRIAGTGDWAVSNRLSMTIRTACSSALVGLNEACSAISRGDCEAALVGGVSLILAPGMTAAMQEQGFISKDGSCKSFSAEADGYARGEAVTAIYIKPLDDAIRDGNPIRAVVRATSHNSDGKTSGLSQPSTDAHEALIRRAYQLGGITDYSKTAMVECHGTGTPIGDPIEAKAVARVFGEKGVYIGSVKPNLGHTEAASGLVSLLKMVMALENRIIPPNIKFKTPNPNIPFEAAKLTVPLEATPWPDDRLERVSLNSFGIGGANAHVILEADAAYDVPIASYAIPEIPQLLLFSANCAKPLTRMIDNYKPWVEKNQDKIGDLAYTLACRREHLSHRAFAVVNSGVIESVSPHANLKTAKRPSIIMVFTGQGAQWPQMGRELMHSSKVFKSSIQSLDQYLQGIDGVKPQYSIEEELRKPARKSRLSSAELSQPLCTAIQIALVDTLKGLGVVPNAVVGHSSGELAGAYASEALTARETIIAAHHRGAVTTKQRRAGSMAAIGLSWEETEKYLVPNATIACDNSPKSVTILGDVEAVQAVIARVKEAHPQALARPLQVDKAYHSYHMAEIGQDYLSMIGQEVLGRQPSTLFFSSVTGKLLGPKRRIDAEYWQNNLESPVRFREAVTAILEHDVAKNAVFLEVGPHAALAGPLRQILAQSASSAPYVSAMTRQQNCTTSFLTAIGNLQSLNVDIDLKALFPTGSCLPDLPRYPWNHEGSYWYETRISSEWRHRKYPYHDLLGAKVAESTEIEPMWRNLLHITNVPWIRDHRVGENIVFPFCGYVALAGEAVRQLTKIEDGFSIRNIIVSTALILTEGKPTEMMTMFRPHRLTNSLDSDWWEFTVSAYSGRNWVKHCTGEVSALSSKASSGQDPNALPRELNVRKWYENMAKGGLDLGPSFQTLDTMATSSGSENRAVGNVINGRQGDEANYHIHPTVLDATLQLMGAAAVNGYAHKTRNWLPTSIESFTVYRCSSNMVTSVSAKLSSNLSIVGEGSCISEGKTVVKGSGIKSSLADGAGVVDILDPHASARCEWSPDINFLDVTELIHAPVGRTDYLRLLEELGDICLLLSKRRISVSETRSHPPHLQKYIIWLTSRVESAADILALNLKSLDNESLLARIDDIMTRLSETPAATVASAIHQVYTKMDLILSGQDLEDILPETHQINLYGFIGQLDRSQYIRTLSHSKPNLRILEIGTGKGSLHRKILNELKRPDGEILCSKYTLTSPGYIFAKDEEQLFPDMEYLNLEITQDPFEQGFEGRQYDLIVACNVFRKTMNLQMTLDNVKKLLRPDGRLLLQEICSSSNWITYVLGVLPSWDSEIDGLYIGKEEWKSQLAAAGLGISEDVVLDAEEPHQLTTTLVVRQASFLKAPVKHITALCNEQGPVITQVLSQLERVGYQITVCKLEEVPPAGQDIISLLDVGKPFFENMNIEEARYSTFKTFIHSLRAQGIFWVTHLTEVSCRDPRYAQVLGFSRCIRSEQLADLATCQVDSFDDPKSIDKITRALSRFQLRQGDETLNPDFEWAIFNDRIQLPRFHPFVLSDELLVSELNEKATLDVRTPGRVNSLHWARHSRENLKADEVEVQDILVALGIVELPVRMFGLEAAGIVSRVGTDVSPNELKVGDRVACGGVGLAAIQVAQMLETEVYVTVGSKQKVDYLTDHYHIPRNRIFNSRDKSFVEDVKRETGGRGMDFILNSLSGELLHATWTCVAEFGTLLEIGKRDLIGNGRLDMKPFLANRSYCCVDIDGLWKRTHVFRSLMLATLEHYSKGHISPLPMEIFTAAQTQDAFRMMEKGQHIGRVGISIQHLAEGNDQAFETTKRTRPIAFNGSASYLLVGGLGGIGRALSTWMVDHGARELIYISRSAGISSQDDTFVRELQSMECDVKLIRGDVTKLDDVERAIAAATHPLKGILQMSMVLANENFSKMSFDEWVASVKPKVQGTWNLHNASVAAGVHLDFFVLFSSLSGIVGQPGQANYASANTFLEGFARYRNGLGLAASVASIGAVKDIGYISEHHGLMGKMQKTGFKPVSEQELMDAMALSMMVHNKPTGETLAGPSSDNFRSVDTKSFMLGLASRIPLNDPSNYIVWKKDRRMAAYHIKTMSSAVAASTDTFKTYLKSVQADPAILKSPEASKLFALEIGRKLFELLLKPQDELNTTWPLVDLGLDSLVALELRAWLKQVFSFDIPMLEMLGMGSLDILGKYAADELHRIVTGNSDGS